MKDSLRGRKSSGRGSPREAMGPIYMIQPDASAHLHTLASNRRICRLPSPQVQRHGDTEHEQWRSQGRKELVCEASSSSGSFSAQAQTINQHIHDRGCVRRWWYPQIEKRSGSRGRKARVGKHGASSRSGRIDRLHPSARVAAGSDKGRGHERPSHQIGRRAPS